MSPRTITAPTEPPPRTYRTPAGFPQAPSRPTLSNSQFHLFSELGLTGDGEPATFLSTDQPPDIATGAPSGLLAAGVDRQPLATDRYSIGRPTARTVPLLRPAESPAGTAAPDVLITSVVPWQAFSPEASPSTIDGFSSPHLATPDSEGVEEGRITPADPESTAAGESATSEEGHDVELTPSIGFNAYQRGVPIDSPRQNGDSGEGADTPSEDRESTAGHTIPAVRQEQDFRKDRLDDEIDRHATVDNPSPSHVLGRVETQREDEGLNRSYREHPDEDHFAGLPLSLPPIPEQDPVDRPIHGRGDYEQPASQVRHSDESVPEAWVEQNSMSEVRAEGSSVALENAFELNLVPARRSSSEFRPALEDSIAVSGNETDTGGQSSAWDESGGQNSAPASQVASHTSPREDSQHIEQDGPTNPPQEGSDRPIQMQAPLGGDQVTTNDSTVTESAPRNGQDPGQLRASESEYVQRVEALAELENRLRGRSVSSIELGVSTIDEESVRIAVRAKRGAANVAVSTRDKRSALRLQSSLDELVSLLRADGFAVEESLPVLNHADTAKGMEKS